MRKYTYWHNFWSPFIYTAWIARGLEAIIWFDGRLWNYGLMMDWERDPRPFHMNWRGQENLLNCFLKFQEYLDELYFYGQCPNCDWPIDADDDGYCTNDRCYWHSHAIHPPADCVDADGFYQGYHSEGCGCAKCRGTL